MTSCLAGQREGRRFDGVHQTPFRQKRPIGCRRKTNLRRKFMETSRYSKKNLGSYRALTCPTLGNKPVPNKLTDKHDVSYWLLTDKKLNLHNAKKNATTIILVCPHHQDAYGAAFADGHCEIMKCPVRFNDSRIRTTLSSCQPFHDATDRIGPPEPKAAMACKSSGTQSPKLPATR